MFGGWQKGEVTIVACEIVQGSYGLGKASDRYHNMWEYIGDVAPEGPAPPFRATFKERFYTGECHEPMVGDQVPVRFKGEPPKVEFEREALRDWQADDRAEQRSSFDAIASAAPGTPVPSPAAPPAAQAAPVAVPDISGVVSATDRLAAIVAAKQAGDEAEVARLKAELEDRLQGGGS